MFKPITYISASLALIGLPSTAIAQDAGFSLGGSASEEGVSTESSGGAQQPDDSASAEPIHHPFELGLFAGVIFPPKDHSLRDDKFLKPYQDYADAAFEFGARLGFYPIKYLGVEGELAMMPTTTEFDNSVNLYALRAHVIGQYPTRYITPFALIGPSVLYTDDDRLGKDADRALHFGVGVKVPFTENLHARLDLRDTISDKQESPNTQHWPEILVGVGFAFGGSSEEAPPQVIDSDGDGIPDDIDQCPHEAANTEDGCPIRDTDGDGVLDVDDKCPAEAEDLDGIQDADGCPEDDADGDGIPDVEDVCPLVAGVKGDDPTRNGCPERKKILVESNQVKLLEPIQFEFNSDTIIEVSFSILDEVIQLLQERPNLRLGIYGHTDNQGTAEYNKELSTRRAASVVRYIVGKGITQDRLESEGFGLEQPVADNETEEGRAKNRRVEFKILEDAAPATPEQ